MSAGEIIDWVSFGAVLFDLDGVVTPTAEIHERAWAELFARWGFDGSDYLTYVEYELFIVFESVGWHDRNANGRMEVSELRVSLTAVFST